jgi:tRNA(Ile)-lysidine synthase
VSGERTRLLHAVRAALAAPPAVTAGEHVLVALSGGPDSTALLGALAALAPGGGWRVTAAHVDHGLRGVASAADRDLATQVAASLGVPLVVRCVRVSTGGNLEGRARRARLRALAVIATECDASRIALGHTADDQAETVLLRLVRGAGRGGLAGMRARRGRLIRPLLACTRADVRRFLAEQGIPFAVDGSNADLRHARNRMRRLVLPLLAAEFHPRLVPALASLAGRLRDEDDVLAALAAERAPLLAGGGLGVGVGTEPPAIGRRIVRCWLERGMRAGVSAEQVERVLGLARGTGGGAVALPGNRRVVREGDRLVRRRGRGPVMRAFELPIEPGGSAGDVTAGWRVTLSRPEAAHGPVQAPGNPAEAQFDGELLGARLVLRSRRPGDRVHLPGVGTRKLQDVMVDARVPREARDAVPLLEADGEILWAAGVARASGAPVSPRTRVIVRGVLERLGPAREAR